MIKKDILYQDITLDRNNNNNNNKEKKIAITNSHQIYNKNNVLTNLLSLDKEIITLLAKRAHLLSKLPKTGLSAHEKQLRISWEKSVTMLSKDPQFTRQLFTLIQGIEVIPEAIEQISAFCLSPKNKPVNIVLPIPSCFRTTQLNIAMAVCSNSEGTLQHVLLNDPIIECIKAFNQLGASLHWEESGCIICSNPNFTRKHYKKSIQIDTVIHIGNDTLSLYLLIFFIATCPARVKFIGKNSLKLADFSPLRKFLPMIGSRLINIIPGQDGLPIRIESSAILPSEIIIPTDLPVDAVIALFIAATRWDKELLIDIKEHPNVTYILDKIIPLFEQWQIPFQKIIFNKQVTAISITPNKITFPENPMIGTYVPGTATLLALPAFVGGTVTLKRQYQQHTDICLLIEVLTQFGLNITETADTICCTGRQIGLTSSSLNIKTLPKELFPLILTLLCIPLLKSETNLLPELPDYVDESILDSYLAQLGLVRMGSKVKLISPTQTPWTSPSDTWGLAISLAAFLRPQIKLSNPGCVEAIYPNYWKIYNKLPTGDYTMQSSKKYSPTPVELSETKKVNRRRIITE
ncbi:5-enolpyruvylshikimate-3-phosphate synthase [Lawsonia intracellularis]|uniref:3-phosphoshikimate 1-carboxyvinyltransferase n=1 Tax=Lawsonia intracellularis TaxID=29546 RepID=UPI000DE4A714|nr:5-enolpyruvylshikimate-3-phosphate synthase [Lawsonia intracellularis]MBZ3892643.1 5-enolpyruvylshikimate-3-phosphate synthase [Lawsonia intracellularis]RBN35754.1 5-enolpyruvylshikimate-3-phosphate synthase [Lawsonia intracellularis]